MKDGAFPSWFDISPEVHEAKHRRSESAAHLPMRVLKYRKRGRKPSLFLSHSSKDRVFVRHLANRLERVGIDVLIDEAVINVGESLIGKISEVVDIADFVGVVLSRNSITSNWVQKETSLAMSKEVAGNKVVVLPILIDDCAVPEPLRDKIYADFRDRNNFFGAFDTLLKALGYSGRWDWYFDDYYSGRLPSRHRLFTEYYLGTPRVMAFWHDNGFTRQDAADLLFVLGDVFAQCDIYRHRNAEGPDAIFISRDAPRMVVASVLDALPYEVQYIFPLDYSDPDCGALSSVAMSVGLRSDTRAELGGKSEKPIPVTPTMLDEIRDAANWSDQDLFTNRWRVLPWGDSEPRLDSFRHALERIIL